MTIIDSDGDVVANGDGTGGGTGNDAISSEIKIMLVMVKLMVITSTYLSLLSKCNNWGLSGCCVEK